MTAKMMSMAISRERKENPFFCLLLVCWFVLLLMKGILIFELMFFIQIYVFFKILQYIAL